ncbi:MAG: hypothetical protein WCG05_05590 [Alphaproteobacteria bacterium]
MKFVVIALFFLLAGCQSSFPDLTYAPDHEKAPLSPEEVQADIRQLKAEKAKLESDVI